MLKQAKVRIVGTPKGKNLFYELFKQNKNYTITVYESPFWDKNSIEKFKLTMTDLAFRQELLAEFISNESLVFQNYETCVQDYSIPLDPIEGERYYIGVDLAKFVDQTAVIILDSQGRLVLEKTFKSVSYQTQQNLILELQRKYNNAYLILDRTGVGEPVYEWFYSKLGSKLIGIKFTNASKSELIENLVFAFENKKIILSKRAQNLLDEISIFGYKLKSGGLIHYSAPEGYHDDHVIALALAYHGLSESNTKGFAFVKI